MNVGMADGIGERLTEVLDELPDDADGVRPDHDFMVVGGILLGPPFGRRAVR